MKKKNLLSIGELSKITGVHIKSLRYYDSLGILKPAYIDPDSGYRYYSFYQKAEIDAIQFCVDLGISLKDFPNYTNTAAPWICYKELVDYGASLLEDKIEIMQQRLARLKTMQTEIERSERSYRNEQPERYELPERYCWLVPYEGILGSEESNEQIKRLILKIHNSGLKLGNSNGLLLQNENGAWTQYLFVDVAGDTAEMAGHPEILHIPAGQYLCKKVECSNISGAWDWCLSCVDEADVELVIETELFVGNYAFSKPVLEQRCLLRTGTGCDQEAPIAKCRSLL